MASTLSHVLFCFCLYNTTYFREPHVISAGKGGGMGNPCTSPLDPLIMIIPTLRIEESFLRRKELVPYQTQSVI